LPGFRSCRMEHDEHDFMKRFYLTRTALLAASFLLQLQPLCLQSQAAPGQVDLSFDPGSGVDNTVRAFAVQPDGKVVIGGDFSTVKGLLRPRLARLNADGSGDPAFELNPAGFVNDVYSLALQPDGKVLVGHPYGIVRLNSNGTLDESFTANLYSDYSYYDPAVFSIAVQPDGKILVGGYLSTIG